MRSEADMARQGKLKHHDGSEVNAMAAKTSVKTSLPNLHNKRYIPILDFAFPKRSWRKPLYSTFAIAITNVTFYYSATPASVYASSARRAVCIIRGIFALYSPEMIAEGLKSNIFLEGMPPDPPCGHTICTFIQ